MQLGAIRCAGVVRVVILALLAVGVLVTVKVRSPMIPAFAFAAGVAFGFVLAAFLRTAADADRWAETIEALEAERQRAERAEAALRQAQGNEAMVDRAVGRIIRLHETGNPEDAA